MKGCSKAFENVIMVYLKRLADRDETFREKLENEKKSISECCDFIASEVNRMGVCGLTDAEVFGLAVHYYDEEEVKIDLKNVREYHAVANQPIELTDEEKEEARKKALEDYQRQMYNEYLQKNKKKEVMKKENTQAVQLSLFD